MIFSLFFLFKILKNILDFDFIKICLVYLTYLVVGVPPTMDSTPVGGTPTGN
jgi:hypothetical protein